MYLTSKRRLPCVAIAVLVLLGSLASAEDKTRQDPTPDSAEVTTAKLVLANELMQLHWSSWVTDDEHADVVKRTIRGINDDLKHKWKVEWLVPKVVATKRQQDDFERAAVTDIRAGEPVLQRKVSDGVQVVLPVRANGACLKCHTALRSPRMPLEVGDLLGIASVQLKR